MGRANVVIVGTGSWQISIAHVVDEGDKAAVVAAVAAVAVVAEDASRDLFSC